MVLASPLYIVPSSRNVDPFTLTSLAAVNTTFHMMSLKYMIDNRYVLDKCQCVLSVVQDTDSRTVNISYRFNGTVPLCGMQPYKV